MNKTDIGDKQRKTENIIIVITLILYFLLVGAAVLMTIRAIKVPMLNTKTTVK